MTTRVLSIVTILLIVCSAPGCGDDTSPSTSSNDEPPPTEDPLGSGPYPIAELTVTYNHPDTGEIAYTISCLGDTATLLGDDVDIDERDACTALADPSVVDRLVGGVPDDQMCTEQYGGPDTATIVGTIDDERVDTTVDRADGCGIADWDGLLAAVLPPAIGITE